LKVIISFAKLLDLEVGFFNIHRNSKYYHFLIKN
jgi:hypothetical protein